MLLLQGYAGWRLCQPGANCSWPRIGKIFLKFEFAQKPILFFRDLLSPGATKNTLGLSLQAQYLWSILSLVPWLSWTDLSTGNLLLILVELLWALDSVQALLRKSIWTASCTRSTFAARGGDFTQPQYQSLPKTFLINSFLINSSTLDKILFLAGARPRCSWMSPHTAWWASYDEVLYKKEKYKKGW